MLWFTNCLCLCPCLQLVYITVYTTARRTSFVDDLITRQTSPDIYMNLKCLLLSCCDHISSRGDSLNSLNSWLHIWAWEGGCLEIRHIFLFLPPPTKKRESVKKGYTHIIGQFKVHFKTCFQEHCKWEHIKPGVQHKPVMRHLVCGKTLWKDLWMIEGTVVLRAQYSLLRNMRGPLLFGSLSYILK